MIQVQSQVILDFPIQRSFPFPRVNGLEVVAAMQADVHAAANLSFHLEIGELLLVFILAIGAFQAGIIPFQAAERAVEDPPSFFPDFSHGWKCPAEGTKSVGEGNLFPLLPPVLSMEFESWLQRLDQEKK